MTKTHDLHLGLSLGVKIRATFAAADRQAGQGVFEDLLETKELDNAQVDRGVETKPALIRTECGIELDAKPAVDLNCSVIVNPWHAEDELTLRLTETLHQAIVSVLRVFFQDDFQRI